MHVQVVKWLMSPLQLLITVFIMFSVVQFCSVKGEYNTLSYDSITMCENNATY